MMQFTPSDWIAIAQVAGAIAMLLVLKPISDLKKTIVILETKLYREFVTYERLNERFEERDIARDNQNQIRPSRPSRRKNLAR